MTLFLLVLNSLACFAIFWVCGTFLLVHDRATCVRHAVVQFALLLSMVGAFAAGVAPFAQMFAPGWWSVVLRVGIGIIALTQYDKVFGVRKQAQSLSLAIQTIPLRMSAWWAERLAIAHRHARTKR